MASPGIGDSAVEAVVESALGTDVAIGDLVGCLVVNDSGERSVSSAKQREYLGTLDTALLRTMCTMENLDAKGKRSALVNRLCGP